MNNQESDNCIHGPGPPLPFGNYEGMTLSLIGSVTKILPKDSFRSLHSINQEAQSEENLTRKRLLVRDWCAMVHLVAGASAEGTRSRESVTRPEVGLEIRAIE